MIVQVRLITAAVYVHVHVHCSAAHGSISKPTPEACYLCQEEGEHPDPEPRRLSAASVCAPARTHARTRTYTHTHTHTCTQGERDQRGGETRRKIPESFFIFSPKPTAKMWRIQMSTGQRSRGLRDDWMLAPLAWSSQV